MAISDKKQGSVLLSQGLLPWLSPPACLRSAIYAASGSGKSTIADRIAAMYPGLVLLIDPDPTMHLTRGQLIRTWPDLRIASDRANAFLRISDDDMIPLAFRYAFARGNCLVIIDEADLVFPRANCSLEYLALLKRGRRRGISTILISQWPASINPVAANLVNAHIIGSLVGEAGRKYVRARCGVQDLPPYTFALSNSYYSKDPVIIKY